jgi:hypothetical protein
VNRSWPGIACAVLLAFGAGLTSHVLYQHWNPAPDAPPSALGIQNSSLQDGEPGIHRVSFAPLTPVSEERSVDLPLLAARDVEKIRALTGRQARIRGRVFRVGYATKSNTYFLNFGPSREALTAVIFASVAEVFEKNKQSPKNFENREVEITGFIKDHPRYGLEVILEQPNQIKMVD